MAATESQKEILYISLISSAEEYTVTEVDSRVLALDGVRGIAILMVLLDHMQVAVLGGFLPGGRMGQHGVTLFFVLSGFLITSQLSGGRMDLRRFYLRRFFRLMPVAWAYLGALLLYNWITQTHFVLLAEVRSCLLLYRNFFSPGTSGPTAHFWSLSLEEQFYLVWPFLLFVAGPGACRVVAAAGAVACAFYRWANFAHYDNYLFNAQTQVRADALLVGCLLALLWDREDIRGFVARWSKLWAVPGMIVGVCIVRYNFLPPLYESVCFALLIAVVLLPEPNRLSAFASSRTLVYLGTISYSVYVWQELFMFRAAGGSSSILLLGIGLPSCVLLSYYLIERPCRRFGRRLTV